MKQSTIELAQSTVEPDGTVAIPESMRRRLGIDSGTRLVFRLDSDDDRLIIEVVKDPVRGLLRHLAGERPVSLEEMDEAIASGVVERFERATGGGS